MLPLTDVSAAPMRAPLPLVSILLITYNHGTYIRQALDGIVMQKGAFELEVVVGNDCSTDNTGDIIAEYDSRYPGLFRLMPQEKNLGTRRNMDRCETAAQGKYVAVLEGDDYWTDPQKLDRQIKFLETHTDFSFCFHNAQVVYEDGSGRSNHLMTGNPKPEYTLDDITKAWNIATASVVYRNGLMPPMPRWIYESVASDLPMFTFLAEAGRVGYLPEVMSVYRINAGGVSRAGQQEKYMQGILRMHENVDRHLDFRYHRNLSSLLIEDNLILTNLTFNAGKRAQARHYLLQAMRLQLANGKLPTMGSIKTLVATVFPKLAQRFSKSSRDSKVKN